jgi:hypothetical protein
VKPTNARVPKYEDGAAARIVEQLEQSGLAKVTLDGVRPVEAAIRYFRSRLPRMDYAAARRAGLPIGSGNVEATCKSLVTVRMKRLGARWKHTTGDEVMQLRALQLSDRWAAAQRQLDPIRSRHRKDRLDVGQQIDDPDNVPTRGRPARSSSVSTAGAPFARRRLHFPRRPLRD